MGELLQGLVPEGHISPAPPQYQRAAVGRTLSTEGQVTSVIVMSQRSSLGNAPNLELALKERKEHQCQTFYGVQSSLPGPVSERVVHFLVTRQPQRKETRALPGQKGPPPRGWRAWGVSSLQALSPRSPTFLGLLITLSSR